MNILPHKSWHVYSQKNREKVQKDEAEAKEEEQRVNDRAIKAEREYRLNELRRKAKARQSNTMDAEPLEPSQRQDNHPTTDSKKSEETKLQHINFWADLDTPEKNDNVNVYSRKIVPDKNKGAVGEPLIKKDKPEWYLEDKNKRHTTDRDRKSDRSEASKNTSRDREDPLSTMKALSRKRSKSHESQDKLSSSTVSLNQEKKVSAESKAAQPMSNIEKLRKERFEREEAERVKARALLDPHYRNQSDRHNSVGGYNQQFNPDATKQAHHPPTSHSRIDNSRYQRRQGQYTVSEQPVKGIDYHSKRRRYD